MRNNPKLTILLLLLGVIRVHCVSVDEVLETNQYIFLLQNKDYTFFETKVPDTCPDFITVPETARSFRDLGYARIHLLRDPAGLIPPRAMIVRHCYGDINVRAFSLNATKLLDTSYSTPVEFLNSTAHSKNNLRLDKYINSKRNMKLNYTLFDSVDRVLYLVHYSDDTIAVNDYFLSYSFEERYNLHKNSEVRLNLSDVPYRFDWSEDAYAQKFYYKEKIGDAIQLFEIPMRHPSDFISGKKSGKLVDPSMNSTILLGLTGGVSLYVNLSENSAKTAQLKSLTHKKKLSCNITRGSIIDRPINVVIIMNNDYCLLRDGENYNKAECEAEKRQFFISKGIILEPEDNLSLITWFVLICIAMLSLIILLCIYIYWLRSTFVSDEEAAHQNDYETEASLFVAKHRSFPSAYQDPALLDVSVDRWN